MTDFTGQSARPKRWLTRVAMFIIAVLGLSLFAQLPAHAAGGGVLAIQVTPVDQVSGQPITSIAFGQHNDVIVYKVAVSCNVADCTNARVVFSPSQLDPYGLLAGNNTLLQYQTWTAPAGAGTPTGSDSSGWTFPLGLMKAGDSVVFNATYAILAIDPNKTIKPAQYYPDGFAITMSATAQSDSASNAAAVAAPVTWHDQVPDPAVGVWPPASTVAPDTVVKLPLTMSSGSSIYRGLAFDGTSQSSAAGNYTVTLTLPVQAVPTSIPDGGVYNAVNHTITWTKGTQASPDVNAAGGWGLNAPTGWYGDNTYYPRSLQLTFPGTAFDPTGCNFSQAVNFSISTSVTYLDPARTTKTAQGSAPLNVTCVPPFPGSQFNKRNATGATDVVPSPGNPPLYYTWEAYASNTSNVDSVATITDSNLDQPDAPVVDVWTTQAATFQWKLDDGTTGTTASSVHIQAPAGRHYVSVTTTSALPAGRVKPTDTTASTIRVQYYYTVSSTAPVGQSRTNTAAMTMAYPTQAGNPAFAPTTQQSSATFTFASSTPTITATFAGPAQVAGGGQAVPGRNVTFTVNGTTTNLPSTAGFTPEYVFIAPAGWSINPGSASFAPGSVPPGAVFSYDTKNVGGVNRQVVVATWPSGTTFGSVATLPTMTVLAQPTSSVSAGTTSTASAWVGDSARTWNNTTAQWTNGVQNAPDVDNTGDLSAWFSTTTQNVFVSSIDSLTVVKQICLPDTTQADGCQWIGDPGTSVPVEVGSQNILYRITLKNTGNTQLSNVVGYDVLPYPGDTGLIPATANVQRGSGFTENLQAVSGATANLNLSFSNSTNPTRPEVSSAGTVNDWNATAAGKKAIRVAVNGSLAPGASGSFTYTAKVGTDATVNGKACNSIAIASTQTPAAEPASVCALLTTRPSLLLTKTADTTALSAVPRAGQTITYTFTTTNNGDVPVSGVVVQDPLPGLSPLSYSWPGSAGTLAPGEIVTATATYALTQADIDAGRIANTATSVGQSPGGAAVISNTASTNTPLAAGPALTFTKSASPPAVSKAGDLVTFTLTATNSGNVTLTGVAIADPLPGVTVQTTNWPGVAGVLAPGQTTVQTATYVVTQNDIDSGAVNNTATANGKAPNAVTVTKSSSATVAVNSAPKLTIVKSASPSDAASFVVGQVITYSYVVTNAGNQSLANPTVAEVAFDGSATPVPDCTNLPRSLAPAAQGTCTATYTLTQADIDRGSVQNTANATATAPGGVTVTAANSTVTIPGIAAPAITLVKSASQNEVTTAGETLTYAFQMTNTGNVTLSGVKAVDAIPGVSALTYAWPAATGVLLPGQTATATATYTVTQADIDSGAFTNTATVTGVDPHGTTVNATSKATVTATRTPALDLVKSTGSHPHKAGDVITYDFSLRNTGNVTVVLVDITDAMPGLAALSYVWPGTPGVLAPGQTATATAHYAVTQADIDAGHVANTATATGTAPDTSTVEATPSHTDTQITASPALLLTKTADASAVSTPARPGEVITYTFSLKNTGNVTVTGASISDPLTGLSPLTYAWPGTVGTLAPGDIVTATAKYSLTQADIDAGHRVNTATAAGQSPDRSGVTSNEASTNTTFDPAPGGALAHTGVDDRTTTPALIGTGLMIVIGLLLLVAARLRREHS
ncbi:MAG: DUF11 domain-containing protein [Actinobacteria bacterium]|nr:DUF11 domain-containing protein [Actinomycetota bacterium]